MCGRVEIQKVLIEWGSHGAGSTSVARRKPRSVGPRDIITAQV